MEITILKSMPPITRSLSKFMDREKIPEKDREKMVEAAYILLTLMSAE